MAVTKLLHILSEMPREMVDLLHKNKVTYLVEGRNSPGFEDPTEKGLKKLCNTTWIQETMARNPLDEESGSLQDEEGMLDFKYEIADVI